MVSFILAVNFMWVTPTGHQESRPMSGTYTSHAECIEAMKSRGDAIRITNGGIQPVPIGTDLCRAIEKVAPRSTPAADAARKAAQDAVEKLARERCVEVAKREKKRQGAVLTGLERYEHDECAALAQKHSPDLKRKVVSQ